MNYVFTTYFAFFNKTGFMKMSLFQNYTMDLKPNSSDIRVMQSKKDQIFYQTIHQNSNTLERTWLYAYIENGFTEPNYQSDITIAADKKFVPNEVMRSKKRSNILLNHSPNNYMTLVRIELKTFRSLEFFSFDYGTDALPTEVTAIPHFQCMF